GLCVTQAEAEALFATDLRPYVAAVRATLAQPVPQPFFDACCSLCFNIGQPNFAQSSVVRLATRATCHGLCVTQAEAEALFATDLRPYVAAVRATLAQPV
ncbi:hypothetical protein CTI14_60360, partial [Methylobacterium radiotolerans]